MQEIWFWHANKWYFSQPRISPGKWDAQTHLGFRDTNGSLNLGQTTRSCKNPPPQKKTELAELWTLLSRLTTESEKKDKYLDLGKELEKLWNMKVTIIPIVTWRCPWCNGYGRRNWTRRHEFKSWTDCISHSTNSLGMNPIILPPAMGKIVGQTRFFSLGEVTSLGEGKLWIQTC